jgi:unspecific monooxygenase
VPFPGDTAVPGPKGHLLVGNSADFDRDPVGWLRSTHAAFGDVVRLDNKTITIYHPDDIHRVLAETNRSFVIDKAQRPGRAGRSELAERHREWESVNPYMRKCLDRVTVGSQLDRIFSALSSQLASSGDEDHDIFVTAQRICGQIVASYFLGSDGDTSRVTGVGALASRRLLSTNEHPEARRVLGLRRRGRRSRRAHEELLELVAGQVRLRHDRGPGKYPPDVLDLLLADAGRVPDDIMAAVIDGSVLAGFSVPGAALSWLLVRLARHPAAAERIAAEGRKWAEASRVRVADRLPMSSMPYTTAVVNEVLRLHPPHWLMGRLVVREVNIGGYQIEPGHSVLFAPYLVHRDQRWWPEPEMFWPERWLTAEIPHAPHAYLPFGAGPRTCPGAILGTVELILLAAELTRFYRMRLIGAQTVAEQRESLLLPADLRGRWQRCGV